MKSIIRALTSVSAGTWIRTAVLALALINQCLSMCGKSVLPITDDQLTEGLSLLFTIGASLAAWWNNNSFTSAAIAADAYLQTVRTEE